MTHSPKFLDGDPDELGELLVQVARRERAPHAARERALGSVAAASLSAAVVTSAKAATVAAPAFTNGSSILAAKWLAIGLGGALVGLTAVDQAERVLSAPTAPAGATRIAATPSTPPPSAAFSVAEPAPVAPAPSAPLPMNVGGRPTSASASPAAARVPVLPPSAADFAPSVTPLAREVMTLRQARAALAEAKPARALEMLAAHRRDFPVAVLATEESALRVEIAFALGDARARELAQHFLAEHPASPLASRVRHLLESKRTSGDKP
jgi:hypothetical protein